MQEIEWLEQPQASQITPKQLLFFDEFQEIKHISQTQELSQIRIRINVDANSQIFI